MAIAKLDVATRRAALDKKITAAEAKTLIKEAKASGSKKPIDDIFKAIDRTSAAIETGATRLILKELDQPMTKAEWVAYAQKAASPAGVWGPGSDGGKNVKRADVPAPLPELFDYLPPAGVGAATIAVGARLRVPFGPREMIGVVVAHARVAANPKLRVPPWSPISAASPASPAVCG